MFAGDLVQGELSCPVMRVETGLDGICRTPELLTGRRWALVSNHAAVTANLVHARIALPTAGCGRPTLLLAPEHGLDGVAQDMEAVADTVDPVSGLEIRSLYGHDATSIEVATADLDGLDAVVVDLPDIGARYYTFAATMDAAMAACADAAVELVVLDRPNPIGGVDREGGLVQPGFESFVSRLPTPVRHGLTLGEIALLLQRDRYPALELTVVPCRGWQRQLWLDQADLPWVPPSPNMPTLETAALYPGMCLVEATTLSEGRGTTRPFHLVGAPKVDAENLTTHLTERELPGVAFRAARFRPMFQKHAGEICGGVEIHVTDRHRLEPLRLGLEVLRAFRHCEPEIFGWRPDPYEFVADIPAVDLLTGSADAREVIDADGDLDDLLATWRDEVRGFEKDLYGILLAG